MLGEFRELAVSWQQFCRDSWIFSQHCIAGELLSSDQQLKLQWDRDNFQCLLLGMLPTSILLSRNLCFSKRLGKSIEVSMMVMGNFEISTKLNSIWYFSHFLKYKVKWRKIIKVGIVNEFHTYIHVWNIGTQWSLNGINSWEIFLKIISV